MITQTVADQLRPTQLSDYVGQAPAMQQIQLSIDTAIHTRRPMEHVLLDGPSGSGKTTLARLIAARLHETLLTIHMPLQGYDYRNLAGFQGVLFLDELHRGTKAQQEELLPLLESGFLRPRGRARLDFTWLTVIGATSEPMKVIPPLRDRFPLRPHFHPYTDEEVTKIVLGMAHRLHVELTEPDAAIFAQAAAGRLRLAGALVQTAADLEITTKCKADPLYVLEIDQLDAYGLGPDHREYLDVLWRFTDPVGLVPLKNLLDKDERAIRELERLLIRQGLVTLTQRGRELTSAGIARIKKGATL